MLSRTLFLQRASFAAPRFGGAFQQVQHQRWFSAEAAPVPSASPEGPARKVGIRRRFQVAHHVKRAPSALNLYVKVGFRFLTTLPCLSHRRRLLLVLPSLTLTFPSAGSHRAHPHLCRT